MVRLVQNNQPSDHQSASDPALKNQSIDSQVFGEDATCSQSSDSQVFTGLQTDQESCEQADLSPKGTKPLAVSSARSSGTSSAKPPIGVGIIGVGSYGNEIIRLIRELGSTLDYPIRVSAVYEADAQQNKATLDRLISEGVCVHESAQALAEDPSVGVVWLPLPIHLHATYTQIMLKAGKAVLCEKPVAASLADVDQMIQCRDQYQQPVLIGFQEIYDPSTFRVKSMLVEGALGAVNKISVRACWPRSRSYFSRNTWAGKRLVDGQPVHDSPVSNALAHFANLALFFAGQQIQEAAIPTHIDGHLYRCADIENFDTAMLRVQTQASSGCADQLGDHNSPEIALWMTHACQQTIEPIVCIDCERGRIVRHLDRVWVLEGDLQTCNQMMVNLEQTEPTWKMQVRDVRPMMQALGAAVQGVLIEGQINATLELSRPHVQLIEKLAELPVERILENRIVESGDPRDAIRAISGIENCFKQSELNWLSASVHTEPSNAASKSQKVCFEI